MGGPSGWGPDELITGLLVSGVQLRVTGYRIIFLIRLRPGDTTILLTPVNIATTRSIQPSGSLKFWVFFMILEEGLNILVAELQTDRRP